MQKHRGEIVNEKVQKSGMKLKTITEGMDISRPTWYSWMDDPNLGYDKILAIGKIINYDFSQDFPDLAPQAIAKEPDADYKKTTLPECLRERDEWKDIYINLLEQYNQVLMGELSKILPR
jgi:hypothetical protein